MRFFSFFFDFSLSFTLSPPPRCFFSLFVFPFKSCTLSVLLAPFLLDRRRPLSDSLEDEGDLVLADPFRPTTAAAAEARFCFAITATSTEPEDSEDSSPLSSSYSLPAETASSSETDEAAARAILAEGAEAAPLPIHSPHTNSGIMNCDRPVSPRNR